MSQFKKSHPTAAGTPTFFLRMLHRWHFCRDDCRSIISVSVDSKIGIQCHHVLYLWFRPPLHCKLGQRPRWNLLSISHIALLIT